MKQIYLDNAATTRVLPEIAKAMADVMTNNYGNPSSIYTLGQDAHDILDEARVKVAKLINAADPEEITFTCGGSEGDSMILEGIAHAYAKKGKHIITSAIEHHAILHACQDLEKQGFKITYLPVDEFGRVNPADVEKAITPETILISVMFANNEIGTLEPIKEIGAIARKHKVFMHTDAVQAVGHVPVDVQADNIDLLTLTAHKFHGPKGTGAIYIRKGIRPANIIFGGPQEHKLRPGTENTAGILGLGMAAEHAMKNMEANSKREAALRDKLIKGILTSIPYTRLNGHPTDRLPNNVNISIQYIEGEGMLLHLDMEGIAASSGSACTSGTLDPSHVLLAIGLPHEIAHGSLRLTMSEFTTEEDIDYVLAKLPDIVKNLRAMSPLYKERKEN
jgi:cysteine desulfurase